jgi:hypothetical protein
MEPKRVNIRGTIVPLYRASHPASWCAYQGGDYFEFRYDGTCDRWLISQSAEDRLHDASHVVGSGANVHDAVNDFTATSRRHAEGRAYVPRCTPRCDLTVASLDTLVLVLGEAVRLGYDDARQSGPTRTALSIADVLDLAHWKSTQLLQLRHAYIAGREHVAVARIRGEGR